MKESTNNREKFFFASKKLHRGELPELPTSCDQIPPFYIRAVGTAQQETGDNNSFSDCARVAECGGTGRNAEEKILA